MIVKPLYASRLIVIDNFWDQDDLNNKNRKKGMIQCGS